VVTVVTAIALSSCGGGHSTPSKATSSLPQVEHQQKSDPRRFVRRWLAAEAHMQTTGRTGPYLAASPGCSTCRTLAHFVKGYYAAGGYIRWDGYQIRSMVFTPSQAGGIVTVHAQSAPETIKTSSAEPAKHFPARHTTLYVRVATKAGSYTVTSSSEG
jgi:hypothetical protein